MIIINNVRNNSSKILIENIKRVVSGLIEIIKKAAFKALEIVKTTSHNQSPSRHRAPCVSVALSPMGHLWPAHRRNSFDLLGRVR